MKLANNTVQKVLGVTQQLYVDVYGHVCQISFYVMELTDHDLLLGLDWFVKTGAGIFPGENVLKFNSDVIYLLDDDKDTNETEILTISAIDEDDLVPDMDWSDTTKTNIQTIIKLKHTDQRAFNRFCKDIDDMFAYDYDDLGKFTFMPFTIDTFDAKPIRTPMYRKSVAENEEIDREVEKMLQ